LKELEGVLGDLSYATETELLKQVTELIDQIGHKSKELGVVMAKAEGMEELSKCAKFIADHVRPVMEELRKPVDELEVIVDDEYWPLPRYSEMLFIL
jgi:glutamine synthetase